MTRYWASLLTFVLTLWAYSICYGQAQVDPGGMPANERTIYGLPARLPDLGGLNLLRDRSDLQPIQRTEILLVWLLEEKRHPSPTTIGGGGGEIATGWILQQLIKCLGTLGDIEALDWLVSSPDLGDVWVADAVRLALAWVGDRRQVARLTKIVTDDYEAHIREMAAAALGTLGDRSAIPALREALNDTYTAVYGNSLDPVKTRYPVREAAEVALRVLAKDPLPGSADARALKFTARIRPPEPCVPKRLPEFKRLLSTVTNGRGRFTSPMRPDSDPGAPSSANGQQVH